MGDITFVKRVNKDLEKLRLEMENLLLKLADAKHKQRENKCIFLINNYDLIINVLTVKFLIIMIFI